MVVDKNRTDDHKFILNGEELEEVKSFVYLGSLINTEVSCMPEVNRRLCMARSTIENMTTIWKSQTICKSLKLRIARATAFAVATYGCESWAYSKKVTKKIEAFEMWTYRRLLRVSSLDFKTIKNEANASETNEEKEDETFLVTSSDTTAWKRPSSKGSLQGREAEGDQQEPGRKT